MKYKAIFISILIFMLSSCVLISESTTVPHANYKIEASDPSQKQEALKVVAQVLHSLKFELQPNDWKVWETILDADRLAEKKQELRYKRDNFEVSYRVMYGAETNGFIRLSFYEQEGRQFSKEGIGLFYQTRKKLSDSGIVHIDETVEDVKAAQPVVTPEAFNEQHPFPPLSKKIKYAAFILGGLLVYAFIILYPFWMLIQNVLSNRQNGLQAKRAAFALVSAVVIFPVPLPMSMFGPMILVPGFLCIPFIMGLPSDYLLFVAISISGTLLLSTVASLWFIKEASNKALHRINR